MNKKERERLLRRHRSRMRYIVVLGLMIMLFLTAEYIRGGTAQVKCTVEQAVSGLQKGFIRGQKQVKDLLEIVIRNGIHETEELSSAAKPVLPEEGHMQVHFLDVGQADSTLVQMKDTAMLIDGGNEDDGAFVVEYLRAQGIEHLNYVIGTHPHEDHIGGLDEVVRAFETDAVLLPDISGITVDLSEYKELRDAIKETKTEVLHAAPGQDYELGSAAFEVIAPWRDYGEELNNWSVGVRIVFGENEFVFTGDAEELAEIDMVESGLVLKGDVWKAGHHGSETSNSDWMLDVVDPDYAVISCGKENSYGHPHKSVLHSFQERGIQVFRTDEQGTVIADCNGREIIWLNR